MRAPDRRNRHALASCHLGQPRDYHVERRVGETVTGIDGNNAGSSRGQGRRCIAVDLAHLRLRSIACNPDQTMARMTVRFGRDHGRGDGKRIGTARPATPKRCRDQIDSIRDRDGALASRSPQFSRPKGVLLSRA
jgi:hypothetical protein